MYILIIFCVNIAIDEHKKECYNANTTNKYAFQEKTNKNAQNELCNSRKLWEVLG